MLRQFLILVVVLSGGGCAGETELPPAAMEQRERCVELRRTLFEDPVVRSFMIYPYCIQDRIILRGSVRDYDGYLEAERIAREVPGVRYVRNELEILEEDAFTPRNP